MMGLNMVLRGILCDLGEPSGFILSPKSLILATFGLGIVYDMDCMVLFALCPESWWTRFLPNPQMERLGQRIICYPVLSHTQLHHRLLPAAIYHRGDFLRGC